jgi:ABC-type Fe3+/spermidine/putrescine transport system ATPase subunit
MPDIQVDHVTKRYGKRKILKSLTFNMPNNQLTVILGPSGSGKTTLLRLIAGLEFPDEGRILYDHKTVSCTSYCLAPNLREIGMVFQDLALWPHMTVAEQLSFGLSNRNRVSELLKLVKLEGLESRYPSELSGGEMQRVALARSLSHAPTIWLLDEPLANLDLSLKENLNSEIKRLQRSLNLTAVYVTHDQVEAFAIADIIAIINEGELLQEGDSLHIYYHPKDDVVARFIGYRNVFEGDELPSGLFETVVGEMWSQAESMDNGFLLALRPEQIVIGDKGSLEGRIESISFRDGVWHCQVSVDDYLIHGISHSPRTMGEIIRFQIQGSPCVLKSARQDSLFHDEEVGV